MSDAYTGGCACGAIRYEIPGNPIFMNHCQCRDCQHQSGTGHGSYLTFGADGVKLSGKAMQWDKTADSGNVKTRGFCPTCGSPVYLRFSAMPQIFTVHAASLDDPERFAPQAVTYRVRACMGRSRPRAADIRHTAAGMTAAGTFQLKRFITARDPVYEDVCAELAAGRKTSHWMWFIFPQLRVLGRSGTARFAARDEPIFGRVLERFYQGRRDGATLTGPAQGR